jgi:hypothetical protein
LRIGNPDSNLIYGPDGYGLRRVPQRPEWSAGGASGGDASELARAERQVLAREQAIKASAAGCGTRTTYIYSTGPDGRRYVTGAEVSVTGTEEMLDSIPGGRRWGAIAGVKTSAGWVEPASSDEAATEQAIAELEDIQNDVVAHEAAHKAAAGRFGGPVSYTYTTGPDGKRYITGGEVPISTPPTDDPEEALRNASVVARAALAPGDPSGQDIAVAARAAQMAASARADIAKGGGRDAQKAILAYSSRLSPKGLWLGGRAGAPEGAEAQEKALQAEEKGRYGFERAA